MTYLKKNQLKFISSVVAISATLTACSGNNASEQLLVMNDTTASGGVRASGRPSQSVSVDFSATGLDTRAVVAIDGVEQEVLATAPAQATFNLIEGERYPIRFVAKPLYQDCQIKPDYIEVTAKASGPMAVDITCANRNWRWPSLNQAVRIPGGNVILPQTQVSDDNLAVGYLAARASSPRDVDYHVSFTRSGSWVHPDQETERLNEVTGQFVEVSRTLGAYVPNTSIVSNGRGGFATAWVGRDLRIHSARIQNGFLARPDVTRDEIKLSDPRASYGQRFNPRLIYTAEGGLEAIFVSLLDKPMSSASGPTGTSNVPFLTFFDAFNNAWLQPNDAQAVSVGLFHEVDGLRGTVASNSQGDAIYAFSQTLYMPAPQSPMSGLLIAERDAITSAWTFPQSFTQSPSAPLVNQATYSSAAINAQGDAIVAWVGIDGNTPKVFVSARVQGQWLHPSNTVDAVSFVGENIVQHTVKAAISDGGDAVVSWKSSSGRAYLAHRRNGQWLKPQSISDSIESAIDSSYVNVAMDGQNNLVATGSSSLSSTRSRLWVRSYQAHKSAWDHQSSLVEADVLQQGSVKIGLDPHVTISSAGKGVIAYQAGRAQRDLFIAELLK